MDGFDGNRECNVVNQEKEEFFILGDAVTDPGSPQAAVQQMRAISDWLLLEMPACDWLINALSCCHSPLHITLSSHQHPPRQSMVTPFTRLDILFLRELFERMFNSEKRLIVGFNIWDTG